jgi:glycosyltransferase involved in cell wall biosynthesis
MTAQPALSIGLPVYNGAQFLDGLLTNLRDQTFRDMEIVICDNASNDQTRAICERQAKADSRIRYYRNSTNIGAHANFDKTFSLARAPLFKWAACDDLLEPNYLETCVKLLDDNRHVIGAHTGAIYVNALGQAFSFDSWTGCYTDPVSGAQLSVDSVAAGQSRVALVRFVDVLFNCVMCLKVFGVFRRSALEQTRLLQPKVLGADKALLLELALLGPFVHADEKLFIKRFHSDVSGALSSAEVKKWIDPQAGNYWHRLRLFMTYLTTPFGKPVGALTKLGCLVFICAWGMKMLPVVALRGIGLLRTPDDVHVASLASSATPPH